MRWIKKKNKYELWFLLSLKIFGLGVRITSIVPYTKTIPLWEIQFQLLFAEIIYTRIKKQQI